MMSQNPWKTLGSTLITQNPWFSVRKDDVVRPDGTPGVYNVVTAERIAFGILPLWDDGSITLVGQYRYPIGQYSWEIPEGGGPLTGDRLESAQRELREETGIRAQSWDYLGEFHLSNCFFGEEGHVFLARGLEQGEPQPDATEVLALRRVPLREAVAMAGDGRITDGVSIIGLFRLEQYLKKERQKRKPDYFTDMPEEYQRHPQKKKQRKKL